MFAMAWVLIGIVCFVLLEIWSADKQVIKKYACILDYWCCRLMISSGQCCLAGWSKSCSWLFLLQPMITVWTKEYGYIIIRFIFHKKIFGFPFASLIFV